VAIFKSDEILAHSLIELRRVYWPAMRFNYHLTRVWEWTKLTF